MNRDNTMTRPIHVSNSLRVGDRIADTHGTLFTVLECGVYSVKMRCHANEQVMTTSVRSVAGDYKPFVNGQLIEWEEHRADEIHTRQKLQSGDIVRCNSDPYHLSYVVVDKTPGNVTVVNKREGLTRYVPWDILVSDYKVWNGSGQFVVWDEFRAPTPELQVDIDTDTATTPLDENLSDAVKILQQQVETLTKFMVAEVSSTWSSGVDERLTDLEEMCTETIEYVDHNDSRLIDVERWLEQTIAENKKTRSDDTDRVRDPASSYAPAIQATQHRIGGKYVRRSDDRERIILEIVDIFISRDGWTRVVLDQQGEYHHISLDSFIADYQKI